MRKERNKVITQRDNDGKSVGEYTHIFAVTATAFQENFCLGASPAQAAQWLYEEGLLIKQKKKGKDGKEIEVFCKQSRIWGERHVYYFLRDFTRGG